MEFEIQFYTIVFFISCIKMIYMYTAIKISPIWFLIRYERKKEKYVESYWNWNSTQSWKFMIQQKSCPISQMTIFFPYIHSTMTNNKFIEKWKLNRKMEISIDSPENSRPTSNAVHWKINR